MGEHGPNDRYNNCPYSKNHSLNWRRVLGGETKRRGVLVVDLVDGLVERAPVQCAVHPVVPCILQNKEDCDLVGHGGPRWERDARIHTAGLRHWVEEPDLGQFDCEMDEENEFGAGPLFCESRDLLPLNFVLVEVGDARDNNPGETPAKVDDLVHGEAHDTGGYDIVLHIGIPALRWELAG